jgi:hypothetical protein
MGEEKRASYAFHEWNSDSSLVTQLDSEHIGRLDNRYIDKYGSPNRLVINNIVAEIGRSEYYLG